jgi:hypothetical protein
VDKKIKFETSGQDNSRVLSVEFTIIASDENDAYADIESIWDVHERKDVDISELSQDDQDRLQTEIDEVAYNNAYEAWFESQVARADFYSND